MLDELTLDAIRAARARIQKHVVRTPLLSCSSKKGATLFLKPEILQPIGAFKIRGAFNMMMQLPSSIPGVVAHSSGNHAQAVAYAARVLGIRAVIVMPNDAPELKRRNTERDGAEIVLVGNDSDERARVADEIARDRGFTLVPPYDHPMIAAGQGTAGLEVFEDQPKLEKFFCPVSGGGLISGVSVALKSQHPTIEIVGVEPTDANDTKLSLESKQRIKIAPPKTIADGLRVRIPGEKTWPVIQKLVSRVELVTDDEIFDAMVFALRELRLILEPSGAAALAAALREKTGTMGVMLSGGNVDAELFERVVARAHSRTFTR